MKDEELELIKALIDFSTSLVNLAIGIVGYKAIKASKKSKKKRKK